MNTKEKILVAALRLFAVNAYEAVSVSQIAGELGITKGALYKHYKNKRDIFNCIFEYVCRLDVERSRKSGVPEQDYSDMPEAFSHVSAKSLGNYMKEQFRYWSEDEIVHSYFLSSFRFMKNIFGRNHRYNAYTFGRFLLLFLYNLSHLTY